MIDIELLKKNVSGVLEKEGYVLNNLTYSSNNKEGSLSIVVDKDMPISLDDIVDLSGKVSDYLDELDPISEPYTLDISSLGAEKPIDIDKLSNYVGQYVNLHLSHPYKGENILEGTLEKVDEEVSLCFFVKGKKTLASFPKKDVDRARLAIKF